MRCASAARRATTGSPRGWSASTPTPERLSLELQPARWALRLLPDDAAQSLSVLCVVRAADGRWLAGRRARLAGLLGRALGARRRRLGRGRREPGRHHGPRAARGVVGRSPSGYASRRWSCCPASVVLLVGLAWLPDGAAVTPDAEHDEFAWWPAEVERWPGEADEPLRAMAELLSG